MQIKSIPNQIINGRLAPLKLNRIDAIVLHHMAHPTATVKQVEQWHINNGWTAIGYNFWIAFDGTIYRGRGFNQGAGVLGHNEHIISIGFQGDYESVNKAMPDKQYNSAVWLIHDIMRFMPGVKRICGHRDFGGSVCPGKYFPMSEIKKSQYRTEETEMTYDYMDNNMPDWAKPTIQKLMDKGLLRGDEQGKLGLNDTMLKIFVINDRAGLYDR